MTLMNFWRSLGNGKPTARAARRAGRRLADRRVRLELDRLEDRITPASVWYVDSTPGGTAGPGLGIFTPNGGDQTTVTGLTLGTNLFTTIGAAVSAASAGDTINVADGTYNELVTANKAGLLFQGNKFNTDARTRATANETIVDGSSGSTAFYVTANDVRIAGFTVQGNTNGNQFGAGIFLAPNVAGSHVVNDIIQNNIVGLIVSSGSSTDPAVVQHDLIANNNQPGPSTGSGIYTDQFTSGTTLTNLLIDSNTISGNADSGIDFSSTAVGSQSAVTISNNSFSGNGRALFAQNLVNSSFTQNTVTGSNGAGTGDLRLFGGVNGLTIANNFLQNGVADAIKISNDSGTNDANITVNNNSISGYTGNGLELVSGTSYTGTLNASRNYWGSPTGPTSPTNPGGTGVAIVDPNNQVLISPFLSSGTDSDPNTPGFQPAPNAPTGIDIVGTAGDDTLIVNATAADAGSYSLNGGAAVPFSGVTTFHFAGLGGNDLMQVNNPSGGLFAPTNGINYDGGTQTGPPGDSLQVLGGTASAIVFGYSAKTANGNNGTIALTNGATTASYTYAGLSPVLTNLGTPPATVVFNLPADGLDNQAILQDNGTAGDGLSQIASGNATFETTTFNNPTTSLTVNDSNDGETVTVARLDSGFTAPITVNGGTGTDTLRADFSGGSNVIPTGGITFAGTGNDAVTLLAGYAATAVTDTYASTTGGSINVDGRTVTYTGLSQAAGITDRLAAGTRTFNFPATNDTVTLGDDGTASNGLSQLASTTSAPTTVFANATTALTVNLGLGADTITAGPLDATAPTPTVNLNGNNGTDDTSADGADTFNVTPSASTAFNVDGDQPSTAPGDTLNVTTTGTTNPFLNVTAVSGASLTGSYTFGNRQPVHFQEVETLAPSSVDFSITKTDNQTSATPGTTITYTIVATNDGTVGVNGVTVADTFAAPPNGFDSVSWTRTFTSASSTSTAPASGTGNISQTVNLAAGDSVTYTATARIDPAATGSLSNTATVTAPAGVTDPTPANNSATDTDTLTPSLDLAVTGTASPSPVSAGTNLTYTFTVTNSGQSTAPNVQLTDALPSTTTFVSAMSTQGTASVAQGVLTANLGAVGPGASVTVLLVVRVNANTPDGSMVPDTATVSTSGTDTNPMNNMTTLSTPVIARADLAVSGTSTPTPPAGGQNIYYTLLVTSAGPSDAQAVTLSDVLPAGTIFQSVTVSQGTGAAAGGTVTVKLGTLPAGGTAFVVIAANIPPGTVNRTVLTDTANVSSSTTDPSSANNAATVTATVVAPSTIGVFDPNSGTWYLKNTIQPGTPDFTPFRYGAGSWIPLTGDWDGNGTSTVGAVDPRTMLWYLRNENSSGTPDFAPFAYGAPGWIPVVGDWDGNNTVTVGAVDPASMTWYLRNSNSTGAPDFTPFQFGQPGDVPVVGDWDGNGTTTIGVFRPSTATWYLRNSNSSGAPDVTPFAYGKPGDVPVTGDWNGDKVTTVGVFDPVFAGWQLRNRNDVGAPDYGPFAYGGRNWEPVSGAYGSASLMLAGDGAVAANPAAAPLSQASLNALVGAALTRLQDAGVNGAVLGRLASAQYQVGSLPGPELGMAVPSANLVVINPNAAGHGWFVDPTPQRDEEYAQAPWGNLYAQPGTAAGDHMDLLTVVLHEMGHLAGLPDVSAAPGNLMSELLGNGNRLTGALNQMFARGR